MGREKKIVDGVECEETTVQEMIDDISTVPYLECHHSVKNNILVVLYVDPHIKNVSVISIRVPDEDGKFWRNTKSDEIMDDLKKIISSIRGKGIN
jgi:hypothetical protein